MIPNISLSMNCMQFNLLWSATLLVLAIAVLCINYHFRNKNKRWSIIRFIENNLIKTVIGIAACGFLLYCWAYWEKNNAGNLIVVLPKAAVSALSMFLSTSGIVEVKSELKGNTLFITLFTLVYLSAILVSITVILKVLGYKAKSFIRMRIRKSSEKAYIFWGVNDNSLMLAESIYKKEKGNATIVFVELPCINEHNPLVGLFNKNSIQRASICRMEDIEAYLTKALHTFQDINSEERSSSKKDIYSALGLHTLNRFIQNAQSVQFYFLSESEKENMDNLMDIIKFYGTEQFDKIPVEKIYCHARRNSLNNIIARESKKICFADSSYLSVLQLLKAPAYQPANFVDIDTSKTIVTSEFNALVIGFGETGRDTFNFLYEFSSFLGTDGELAPRTIHIMDTKLSQLKPKFINNCPALKDKSDINWWNDMTVDSQDFWDKYKELINKLNYIVITLNDDKTASDLAVKMYQTAYRYRKNLNHFKIFVRLKDSDSKQLLKHVSEYYKAGSDREDRDTNVLVPFGTYRSLFNEEIFDTDLIDCDADRFHLQYEEICDEMFGKAEKKEEEKPIKHVNDDIKQNCFHQQDISNVRHIDTKLILAGAYDMKGNRNEERLKYLQSIAVREGVEYNNAKVGTPAYTIMENLSLCEHLRWNAKMELLGFVPYPSDLFPLAGKKDYAYKTHHCIVSCKELNTSLKHTKIYDWAVVELSFMYYKPTP